MDSFHTLVEKNLLRDRQFQLRVSARLSKYRLRFVASEIDRKWSANIYYDALTAVPAVPAAFRESIRLDRDSRILPRRRISPEAMYNRRDAGGSCAVGGGKGDGEASRGAAADGEAVDARDDMEGEFGRGRDHERSEK